MPMTSVATTTSASSLAAQAKTGLTASERPTPLSHSATVTSMSMR